LDTLEIYFIEIKGVPIFACQSVKQNPKSAMAKKWMQDHGFLEDEITEALQSGFKNMKI